MEPSSVFLNYLEVGGNRFRTRKINFSRIPSTYASVPVEKDAFPKKKITGRFIRFFGLTKDLTESICGVGFYESAFLMSVTCNHVASMW